MTVKVIVTDMDGTFLNDAKQYDRPRFLAQFAQLRQQGIEFVVASGNQYYQLISFFPEIREQISFVAENGALVYEHGKQLFHGELTRHESQVVIGELLKDPQLNFVACGLQSAYVSDKAPDAFVELMSKHYHRLQRVSDYHAIDDTLFKFSLNLPDSEIPQLIDKLHVSLDGIMKPVTSGFGFVDAVITAYNGGAGSVLRVFSNDKIQAANIINTMTPGDVYQTLTTRHPSAESRRYLYKVNTAQKSYRRR